MRRTCPRNITHARRLAAVALALVLGAGFAAADRFPPDPVEELRLTLRSRLPEGPQGQDILTRRIDALRTLSDLRRALLLDAWRDDEPDVKIANMHKTARAEVAKRFGQIVRGVLQSGDPTSRRAVADMIADIGVTAKGIDSKAGLMRDFAPDMAAALKQPDPAVRQAAARALGLINPDPAVAVPALEGLLSNGSTADRLAAAEALGNLVRVALVNNTTRSRTTTGVEVSNPEVVAVSAAVVPAAARPLDDPNVAVRRLCADALDQAAASMGRLIQDPRPSEEYATGLEDPVKEVQSERAMLVPLMNALKDQGAVLARAVADRDPETRLLARRTLEEMGYARYRLRRRLNSVQRPAAEAPKVGAKEKLPELGEDDALLDGLRVARPALAAGIADPDVRAQLAALDALETLGGEAAPAAPALIRALGDRDRFVRWAAARVLTRAGAVEPDAAVPALVRLVNDSDLDLRRAATSALSAYGPVARAAVPALVRALGATDAEMRVAVIKALEGIGTDAAPAIPGLANALSDPDARVRQIAAEALTKFGPAASAAVPQLRRALDDESPEVRRAASDALLSIIPPAQP
jgi:hypothetical protein